MKRRVSLLVLLSAVLGIGAAPLRRVDIDADEMIVKSRSQQAVFTGHVVVVREDYRMTCNTLTVRYDESHKVKNLTAEGSVKVVSGGRTVTSQRADLDNTTEVLTLTGDPVMTEGENTIRGEVIIFDLPTDEVRVKKVRASVKMKDVIGEAGAGGGG